VQNLDPAITAHNVANEGEPAKIVYTLSLGPFPILTAKHQFICEACLQILDRYNLPTMQPVAIATMAGFLPVQCLGIWLPDERRFLSKYSLLGEVWGVPDGVVLYEKLRQLGPSDKPWWDGVDLAPLWFFPFILEE